MKKKFAFVLILAMLLSLCACTDQEQTQPETSEESASSGKYTYATVAPEDRTSETCRFTLPDGTYCGAPVTDHKSMCNEHFDSLYAIYDEYAEVE